MGEYRREDDVLRLYFVIDYNNTQQHTRTTTISAVYSRPLTLCTRLTPTTRCAHNTRHTQDTSSSSNRRFCQRRRRHHDSARSPPSPHFSLSSTGAAEGSGFHSRRASRRARITQHTHRTKAGRRHPQNSTRRAAKHPAAAAAATAAHLTAHTKAPALVDRDISHIDLPLCDLTPSR